MRIRVYLWSIPVSPLLPEYPEGQGPHLNPGTVFKHDCSSKQGFATPHSSTSLQYVPLPVSPAGQCPHRKSGGQSVLKHSTP